MRLRAGDPQYDKERSCCGAWLTREELEGQKRYFQSQPDLFGYLLAAEAFYHRQQPREVLSLIPDAARQAKFSYTQFSRQVLRGFALEALGDRNARAFWLSLLPGAVQPYQREAVELAIFQHDKKAGVVGRLLETGSPILHPLIRQKIIEDDAGPDLLRQQAKSGATPHQREVGLYLLLADELHHAWYREFVADQRLVGPRSQPKGDDRYQYGSWSVADYDPTYSEAPGPPPLYIFAAGGSDDLKACPNIERTAASLAADARRSTRACASRSSSARRASTDGASSSMATASCSKAATASPARRCSGSTSTRRCSPRRKRAPTTGPSRSTVRSAAMRLRATAAAGSRTSRRAFARRAISN